MNDQNLLSNLMDFSNLRNTSQRKQKASSKQSELEFDQNSNQAIVKSFKELREKLKQASKQNSSLKQQIKTQKIKFRQTQEALQLTLQSNLQLKQKVTSLNNLNDQLKKKLALLKQSLQKTYDRQQEVEFTRSSMLEMKLKIDQLEEQRQKLLQMSVQEKMRLQQQINRLRIKGKSDQDYIQKIEADLSRSKETMIKLENNIKKMQITHDENLFTNKWTRENFETEHLQQTIKQLDKEVLALRNRNKKQKERKVQLEDRVIELQQLAGLSKIQAQTYSGQLNVISKKIIKLQKKLQESKVKIKKTNDQKLQIEEKSTKILLWSNQFINELKKQHCVISQVLKNYQTKIKNLSKAQTQTLKFMQTLKFPLNNLSNLTSQRHQHNHQQQLQLNDSGPKTNRNYGNTLYQKKNNQQRQASTPKILNNMSRMTFGQRGEQNQYKQTLIIQNKIRRQRQQMQRKLKQKNLLRKIQTSQQSNHYKLREDYIRSVDRRY